MTTRLTTEFKPIPLPDYVELPIEEMRQRAELFYDMIRKRHTVRDFSSRRVPRAIIEQCISDGPEGGDAVLRVNPQIWSLHSFCLPLPAGVGAYASRSFDHRVVSEPVRPPGTCMLVQVPCCTNFQELPWKSTVEVP